MVKVKKLLLILAGCASLGLGIVGIVLPILPTVPFFLLTLFCFTNSSDRLKEWFLSTKFYKNQLESFVKKEGMRLKTKLAIIITVTALMGFGFFMMARKGIWIPCIILAVVWVCHLYYFIFRVKTIR